MASLFCRLCICFVILSASSAYFAEASREFIVGDGFGWKVPPSNNRTFYTHWAERNRFLIGDSLSFEYQNDSVVEVSKWGYFTCNTTDSITEADNGKSTLQLDRSGPYYFISGFLDHCKNGQRLIVEVMGLHHIPRSFPPDSYEQPSPSPFSWTPAGSGVAGLMVKDGCVFMGVFIATFVCLLA